MTSQLDRYEAREEISRLIYGYCESLDEGDFAAVGELFARGAWRPAGASGPAVTGDDLSEWLAANVQLHGARPGTRHCTTNLVIDLADDGSSATSRSYVVVFQALEDMPPQAIILAHYHDRFTYLEGRWSFEERAVEVDGAGDVSRHLKGQLPHGD